MSSKKARIKFFEKKQEELLGRHKKMVQKATTLSDQRKVGMMKQLDDILPALNRLDGLIDELYDAQGPVAETIISDSEALIAELSDLYIKIDHKLKPRERPHQRYQDDDEYSIDEDDE